MELTKLHTEEQPLLKRSAVTYRLASDAATPSKMQVAQSIGSKEKGTVVVTHVYPATGEHAATVKAHIYSDGKAAIALERANLLAKQKPKEEPKAEADGESA